MKDGKFETQAEIYQALLDGKKITRGKSGHYLQNINGMVKWEDGKANHEDFSDSTEWKIYEDPKPKKKIMLYRYTYKYGSAIHQTNFTSKNWSTFGGDEDYLLLTESKEVECDDV